MDTTYFGRDFGVMVLMDSINGQALFVGEVKHETNALYSAALNALLWARSNTRPTPYTAQR